MCNCEHWQQCDECKPEARKYLIWSKDRGGAWYRPESAGYTINPDIAGRYTKQEADNTHLGTHGDCVGYLESSPFVTKKRNEYLQRKRKEIRCCLETMTPQQVIDVMPELIKERIDMLIRKVI